VASFARVALQLQASATGSLVCHLESQIGSGKCGTESMTTLVTSREGTNLRGGLEWSSQYEKGERTDKGKPKTKQKDSLLGSHELYAAEVWKRVKESLKHLTK
jgi:hypothetical protein